MSELNLSLTAISNSLSRSQLREIISLKDVTIGNLLSANRALQDKITTLEHDKAVLESIIKENNAKIDKLTEENKKLKEQVEILEKRIVSLEEEKKSNNSRSLLSKLILAIQEVNKRDDLQGSGGLEYLEDFDLIKRAPRRLVS